MTEQSRILALPFPGLRRCEMGRFYGIKIKAGETNAKTGKPWTIKDVPKLWQKATKAWLADNAD